MDSRRARDGRETNRGKARDESLKDRRRIGERQEGGQGERHYSDRGRTQDEQGKDKCWIKEGQGTDHGRVGEGSGTDRGRARVGPGT